MARTERKVPFNSKLYQRVTWPCQRHISESAASIVAAVSDCNASAVVPSPVTCAVDIFSLIDSMIYFIIKVDLSLKSCNPSDTVGFEAIRQYQGVGDSAVSSATTRRLQEVLTNATDVKRMLEEHWGIQNGTQDSLAPSRLEGLRSTAMRSKKQSEVFV